MQKAQIKRYVILIVAVLVLIKVFSCRLVDYQTEGFKKTCPPLATAEVVSADELAAFLPLWSEYVSSGLDETVPADISLLSGNFSDHLPWKLKWWLERNCWTAERFYYVAQRLQTIVQAVYLKQHTDAVKEVLSAQMAGETDQDRVASYQEMIAMQDKIANIEAVSAQELKMVAGQVAQIEQLLNKKEIRKK